MTVGWNGGDTTVEHRRGVLYSVHRFVHQAHVTRCKVPQHLHHRETMDVMMTYKNDEDGKGIVQRAKRQLVAGGRTMMCSCAGCVIACGHRVSSGINTPLYLFELNQC